MHQTLIRIFCGRSKIGDTFWGADVVRDVATDQDVR